MKERTKAVYAWALYDWANSTFATTVMAGFFPVMFKHYWAGGLAVTESSFRLGVVSALASVAVALLAPLLGAIADRAGARKGFLLASTALGVAATGALYWVAEGHWQLAAWVYAVATLGFSGGTGFYNALLPLVAERNRLERVSALGFALGYLGGALLFALNVLMVLHPAWFGLEGQVQAMQVSFVMVAVWWALFTLPLALWVHEPVPRTRPGVLCSLAGGLREVAGTLRHIGRLRDVWVFLLAYWLYMDGVGTIMRMAVDYGLSLGFGAGGLLTALLLTQAVGFPAALVFGRLGERWGPRAGIQVAIAVYMGVCVWAYVMDNEREFYLLAVMVGLVQGGIQALSRSFFARIVPADKSGEFFGFYNVVGRFAVIIGPVLMGWVGAVTGSTRLSVLSLMVLFAAGAWLLGRVCVEEDTRSVVQ